jgi:uncharacterized protein YqeY
MSLLQEIKAQQLDARKQRNKVKANLLTTLIGEVESFAKTDGNREVTDSDVIATLKKFLKGVKETIVCAGDRRDGDAADLAWEERTILESLMPAQLSEDELRSAIIAIVEANDLNKKGLGLLMKELKEKFEGLYDGAMASKLAKEILQ